MKTPSRFLNSIGLLRELAGWGGLALLLFWAWHLKHPLMFFMRPLETPLLLGVGLLGSIYAAYCRYKSAWFASRQRWGTMLCGMLCLFGLTAGGELRFRYQRQQVLAASPDMRALGQHFIVGFTAWGQLDALAAQGLIGGIYLGSRNVVGLTTDGVAARIAHLQNLRTLAGLPPLLVATDQEGGKIAHLSPLLPAMPALSTIAPLDAAAATKAAYAYGQQQGQGLRSIGVNLNLAPVVDLKPAQAIAFGDTHTLISQRAIAADQQVVTRIASAYSSGLSAAGVQPTLKHFPGLGSVRRDTHHVAAHIDSDVAGLARDWQPFREVSHSTDAAIMLGHVTLNRLDANHAVSHSQQVVQEILRKQWGYQGLLITDDLNMGAVYNLGIGRVSREALNAGVDFILVSYDPDQYYRALADIAQSGKVDAAMLGLSQGRIGSWHRSHYPQTMRTASTF